MSNPRKPTAMKRAQGNPGGKKLPTDEPIFDFAVCDPPDLLKGEALIEWDRIMPGLLSAGVLTTVDYPTLARYCYYHGLWTEASEAVERDGRTLMSLKGGHMKNPEYTIARESAETCNKLANELGITPAARAKVSATPRKAAAVKSPFERD